MTMLRSNLHRLLLRAQIFKYRLTISKEHLDGDDRNEISRYLSTLEWLAITNLQYLYMPTQWPHQRDIYIVLLKGEEVRVSLQLAPIDQVEKNTILDLLLQKIMQNTKFLQCPYLNCCFNSFDERQSPNKKSITPGFSLKLWEDGTNLGVFIKPCYLQIDLITSISDDGDIFIDISTGKFFRKTDVVRVQKLEDGSQNLHFRNKMVVPKKFLKLATIKDCVGYDLAFNLKKFLQRIDMTSKDFMKKWSLQLDSKPIDMQLSFVDPGLIFFGRTEKSLNQWIYPTTRNSYINNYKNTFQTSFDAFPETEIIVCSHEKSDKGQKMKIMLEVIAERLKLKITMSNLKFSGTDHTALGHLFSQMNRPGLYMLIVPQVSREILSWLKDQLVKQCVLFDLVRESDLSDTDMPLNEVTVLQHLGTICSKMRLAPWKLKDLPFGQFPVSVVSVSLERKKNGMLSLAVVFSLNSFLSKFMSDIQETTESQAINLLLQMLRRCLDRFLELHKIFPIRLFVFTSSSLAIFEASTLYPFLKNSITQYYKQIGKYKNNSVCIINHTCSHNLRLFNQNNSNFISQDTVRQPELLSHLLWENKMFLQLHNYQPLTQFQIACQEKDPSFLKKLSELIVRLALGSVDGKFGGGLGFLGFSQKLNNFRQYQVEVCWKKYLYDGNMIFL